MIKLEQKILDGYVEEINDLIEANFKEENGTDKQKVIYQFLCTRAKEYSDKKYYLEKSIKFDFFIKAC